MGEGGSEEKVSPDIGDTVMDSLADFCSPYFASIK